MDLIKRAIKDMAHSVDGGYADFSDGLIVWITTSRGHSKRCAAATSRSLKTAARYLMRTAKSPRGGIMPRRICGVLSAVEREAV